MTKPSNHGRSALATNAEHKQHTSSDVHEANLCVCVMGKQLQPSTPAWHNLQTSSEGMAAKMAQTCLHRL